MGESPGQETNSASQLPLKPAQSWWLPSAFGATMVVVLLSTTLAIPIKADDIWWHLKTGEFILSHWTIPDLNIFSYTAPENHWLPHEWLSEVVFYLVHQLAGFRGLIFLGIALNAVACGLIYRLTEKYSRSPFLSAVITLLSSLMLLGNFSLRPYLFGNLFFIATLHAMEEPTAGGKLRPVLIFILFSAWANFHGSFLIGLALIMLYGAASITAHFKKAKRSWGPTRALTRDLLVAVVACMLTPHHIYGLIFPLSYIRDAFTGKTTYLTNISEWQSAGFSSPLGRMITFYVMFCLFAIMGSGVMPSAIHVGLLVAFSFFAYTTIRNIPLLGICATPVLARHLPRAISRVKLLFARTPGMKQAMERFHQQTVKADRRSRKVILSALAALSLVVMFSVPPDSSISYSSVTRVRALGDLSPGFYPQGLIHRLKQGGPPYRIFNYFNWGGAFIYFLYPHKRVFIDQRNDCYPMDVFLDYFAMHELSRDWRYVLDRWQIDAVAYPPGAELTQLLRADIDWWVEYEDQQAVLLMREPPIPWVPDRDEKP